MSNYPYRRQILEKLNQVNPNNFESLALELFRYQAANNPIYREYLKLLGFSTGKVSSISSIPFLPISFFKSHTLKTGQWNSKVVFSSSGTTGQQPSQHHLRDINFYLDNSKKGFEFFYGPVKDYCTLALLPSYLERGGSSLVAMADFFIQQSRYTQSGFFLDNQKALIQILRDCKLKNIPTLLLGVSFALLDLAEQYPIDLSSTIIMETGGMKGRRKEITRMELHDQLKKTFKVETIHSEYGMTELLSQAYSKGEGLFFPSHTMKVITREITDPFAIQKSGKTGAVNIIDLANIDSIAFIATDDLGRVYTDGSFEILGRLDNSDVRGCNLMVI